MLNPKQIKKIKSEYEIIRSQKVLISAYGTLDEAAEALAIAALIAGRSYEIAQWIKENPHMAGRGHKV